MIKVIKRDDSMKHTILESLRYSLEHVVDNKNSINKEDFIDDVYAFRSAIEYVEKVL